MPSAPYESSIPVLDMRDFHNSSTKARFVQALKHAAENVGFFAVTNTDQVHKPVIDAGYDAAFKFFALPTEVKLNSCDVELGGQRGYVQSESAKGQLTKDFKEFFHVGTDEAKKYGLMENLWPTEMDLKTPMMEMYNSLRQYADPLSQAFALAMGADEDLLKNTIVDGQNLLRAIRYPKECPANNIWAAAHTDIDLFTILPRSTADGLEVLSPDGKWIPVKVPDGAFIVNVGDMMQNLSNGLFRSSVHRVVDPGLKTERYSMVMFVHPNDNFPLNPLSQCVAKTGGKAKYPRATTRQLLFERLADLGIAPLHMLKTLGDCDLCEQQIELKRASVDAMVAMRAAGFANANILAHLEELAASGVVLKEKCKDSTRM